MEPLEYRRLEFSEVGTLIHSSGEADFASTVKADFSEVAGEYIIEMDLPGCVNDKDKGRRDVIVKPELENFITITGERKHPPGYQDRTFRTQQRTFGSFTQTFKFPRNIDKKKVKISLDFGVLRIVAPKETEVPEEYEF